MRFSSILREYQREFPYHPVFEGTNMTQFDSTSNPISPQSNLPAPLTSANGEPLATPAVRLGAYALEIVLVIFTLFIGWAIWSLVVWNKGTTPGHQIVRLYIVDAKSGRTASWGHMALREFVIKGIVGNFASAFTFGVYFIVDSLFIVRDDRKTLHDLISSTQVVQR